MLEPLDCVVIGDRDHCHEKLKAYEVIGVDRMMCMMQYGSLTQAASLRSIELAGQELIPTFAEASRELA